MNHILSYCNISLEQGRYTWRHDSVLRTIVDCIRPNIKEGFELFADLASHGAGNGGTIPPDVLVTTQRPDIFLVHRNSAKVVIFELTVPWDNNIESGHNLKVTKYASLVNDLLQEFRIECYCFEVSVRGQISKANKARLKSFLFHSTGLRKPVKLINNVSKAALLGSFSIFSAHNKAIWDVGRDLSVNV